MLIRHFKDSDAEACCDLINASVTAAAHLSQNARFQLITRNVPADLSAELKAAYSLIAEIDGQLVAIGSLTKEGEIRRVYVCPDAQKQGIGKAMIDMLEDTARKHNISELRIKAAPNTVEFYQRLGYAIVGHEQMQIGNTSYDAVKMTKSLATLAGV